MKSEPTRKDKPKLTDEQMKQALVNIDTRLKVLEKWAYKIKHTTP